MPNSFRYLYYIKENDNQTTVTKFSFPMPHFLGLIINYTATVTQQLQKTENYICLGRNSMFSSSYLNIKEKDVIPPEIMFTVKDMVSPSMQHPNVP